MYSGADGAKRHWGCHADIDARKLANIRKAEQIGHDRLAAAVFVGAVRMQSVAAAAGLVALPSCSVKARAKSLHR